MTTTEDKQVYKDWRGIRASVNKFYGITNGLDAGGDDLSRNYPYPSKTKVRILPKDFSRNSGFKPIELFGMDKFNAGSSKVLTIVEGEEDAPSAYQMLGEKFPVVALPNAGVSKALLMNCHEYINSFKTIAVCMDNDEAGRRAAMKLAEAFPNKVYLVSMTKHKDPNDFLTNGAQSDFMFAHINREKYVPEFDVSTAQGFLDIYDSGQDSEYIPTGIQDYDEHHLGLMQACFTIFQAEEGIGKTELFRYFEHNLIKNHPDVAFAMCHLEEPQIRSILGLVSYDIGQNVTRKELVTDEKKVRDSITSLAKNENVHLFTIGTDEDPMVLIDRIKYYANVCECKYIFIEPIQDIAHQRQGTETTEQFLTKLSVQLSRVAAETGVGIIGIAHENDDGKIRDCRMLAKQAAVVIRLTRDVTNPDQELRNTTTLTSLKNRPASYVGYAGEVEFDVDTFQIKEKL